MNPPPLITFAVRAEAAPAQRLLHRQTVPAHLLLTGIGPAAATRAVAPLLAARPAFVLSCGFAGGLNPALSVNTLVAHADHEFPLREALSACGARFVNFLHSDRILASAREKATARAHSRADAVDMESAAIRQLCRKAGIPSATLRVISDAADDDLPLDFSRLIDRSGRFHYGRLALTLLRSPGLVPSLIRFQRQTRRAAEALAQRLLTVLTDSKPAGDA